MANEKEQNTYQAIIESNPAIDWNSKNFLKIMQFYLIETPAYTRKQDNLVSQRGKTFKSYGWEGGDKFKKLLREMINVSRNLSNFETKKKFVRTKAMETYPPTEYCLFAVEKCLANHLLKAIRNSLAHGEFYQFEYNKERIYILQNHHGSLQAEIVLYEKTLLRWIDVIKAGPMKQENNKKE